MRLELSHIGGGYLSLVSRTAQYYLVAPELIRQWNSQVWGTDLADILANNWSL